MSADHTSLRAYYEAEAAHGLRQPLTGRRVELRSAFVSLLVREARRTIVDFGSGPGHDGQAFVDAGLDYVGLDLAHGNGIRARELGVTVLQAAVVAPPLRPGAVDAGWSMSTLMHLPADEVAIAIAAMADVLRSGAPMAIGLWGGGLGEVVGDGELAGHRRPFFLRSPAHNRSLLGSAGRIERSEVWDVGPGGWQYQVFVVRIAART